MSIKRKVLLENPPQNSYGNLLGISSHSKRGGLRWKVLQFRVECKTSKVWMMRIMWCYYNAIKILNCLRDDILFWWDCSFAYLTLIFRLHDTSRPMFGNTVISCCMEIWRSKAEKMIGRIMFELIRPELILLQNFQVGVCKKKSFGSD